MRAAPAVATCSSQRQGGLFETTRARATCTNSASCRSACRVSAQDAESSSLQDVPVTHLDHKSRHLAF